MCNIYIQTYTVQYTDDAAILNIGSKKNIVLKKEIRNYDDRKCQLVCDFNFYEFLKKPVLHPTPPLLP